MAYILVVEQDRPFAEALAWTLRSEGHDVCVAEGAKEAIQLGLTHYPDVVIADWTLHGDMHGGKVCRRIRAACPPVKTIIMTGYPGAASEARRWCEHVEAVVEKPFHKEKIVEIVNQALSGTPCEPGHSLV